MKKIVKAQYTLIARAMTDFMDNKVQLDKEDLISFRDYERYILNNGTALGFKIKNIYSYAKLAAVLDIESAKLALTELKIVLKTNDIKPTQYAKAFQVLAATSGVLNINEEIVANKVAEIMQLKNHQELTLKVLEKHIACGIISRESRLETINKLNKEIEDMELASKKSQKPLKPKSKKNNKSTKKTEGKSKKSPRDTAKEVVVKESKQDLKAKSIEINRLDEKTQKDNKTSSRSTGPLGIAKSDDVLESNATTLGTQDLLRVQEALMVQSGLMNVIKKSIKARNVTKATNSQLVLSTLLAKPDNPYYESIIHNVRDCAISEEAVLDSAGNYTTELTNRLAALGDLTAKKKTELRELIESKGINTNSMILMNLANELISLAGVLALDIAITNNKEVNSKIVKAEINALVKSLAIVMQSASK